MHVEHEHTQHGCRAAGRHLRARSQSGARGGRGGTGDPARCVAAIARRRAHRRHQGRRSTDGWSEANSSTIQQASGTPGRSFTTPAMMALEQETIDRMRAGQGQHAGARDGAARATPIAREYTHLNESQRAAVQEILDESRPSEALEGAAGTGKTTALAAVRDAAEREGYEVEGLRADVSCRPQAGRGRHRVEHAATSSRSRTRADAWTTTSETTLRPRRIELGEHEADAHVSGAPRTRRPRAARRRRAPARSRRCRTAVSPAPGGGDPHGAS